jgi:beta-glucanase (GH16 family)
MKTLPRLLVLCALVLAALSAMSSVAFAASKLVYSDEFNGPLTTSVWSNNTPWYTHYTTGELEYYDPSNCTFANGLMTLKSENRSTSGYSYASGIVTSLQRTKFSYGYFEIRAKLPKGPGVWPAFWLTNDHSLEIDGLEMLGDRPSRIYMTLHENSSQIYQGIKDGPDYSAAFHTYGIDWQPTYVKWYIDGVECASYTKSMPSDPMWICMNTAVGGAWPGSPTSATKFPVNYDIDYVRVYDTKPAAIVVPVANNDSYSVNESDTLTVAAPGVLGNDTAAQGKTLTASVLAEPTHGTLDMTSDGSFNYKPDDGFVGTDSFTYTDSDGTNRSGSAAVSIAVVDPNAPVPTVVSKPVVTQKNRAHKRYGVSGGVRFGSVPMASAAATPIKPVVLAVQVQRYLHGQWTGYRTQRVVNPPSHYATVVKLRVGTFRVRTVVTGGTAPAGQSAWTRAFRVR